MTIHSRVLSSIFLYLLSISFYLPFPLLLFLLEVLADHAVHRVQQRLLLDTHALGEFTQIGGAQYLIGNHSDALHDAADGLRALHGIGHALHRQTRLKRNEVRLVLFDIVLQLLGRVLLGKRVGVVAIGQEQHLDVHTLGQEHVGASHGGMDTGLITII